MKKLIKVLMSLAFVMTVITGAAAEEKEVVFDGKDIVGTTDLQDAFSGLQPGDEKVFSVKFTNGTSEESSWYIEAEVLNSLEKASNSAKNGGYTFKLDYVDPKGNVKNLFDSRKVGGEGSDGLKQATKSTKDEYFFIDDLKGKESGVIKLTIGLDGESQPNSYMNTKADFEIRFAVETKTSTPNTGDRNNINIYVWIFCGSLTVAAGCLGYLLFSKRKESELK